MAAHTGETKYTGEEKVVVAMDIGTTQSAVSFAYLYPQDSPRVNKWPGQPDSVGSSKTPSIVAYRRSKYEASGSEALEYVDDSHYEVAKWFKLHLHPPSMTVSDIPPPYGSPFGAQGFEIPTLPTGVPIDQVYADFMKYLLENTRVIFEQSIPNGAAVWGRLRDKLVVILTTPNGWDFSQQSVLRKAAIAAGIVTADSAYDLLEFVTEGEASVHYALAYSERRTWLAVESVFAVVDAGGSTVDSILYECMSTTPKVLLKEVCPSICIQAGGVFIDRAAEAMLRLKLQGSHYGDNECIADMVSAFEGRTKRLFDGNQATYVVDFGSSRDNDRSRGIIKGKLSLTRDEVAGLFEGVITRIVETCSSMLKTGKVKYVILVGGFGESAYLQTKLREAFDQHGASLVTAEEPSKKAAAEGALIWYIKQSVTARVARATIGIQHTPKYRPSQKGHKERAHLAFSGVDGNILLPHAFGVRVAKGDVIPDGFVKKTTVNRMFASLDDDLGCFSEDLEVWEGDGIPEWTTDCAGERLPKMRTLCTMKADLSGLRSSLRKVDSPNGEFYEAIHFEIALKLGGTQLQALIRWKEGNTYLEGPVSIIPRAIV